MIRTKFFITITLKDEASLREVKVFDKILNVKQVPSVGDYVEPCRKLYSLKVDEVNYLIGGILLSPHNDDEVEAIVDMNLSLPLADKDEFDAYCKSLVEGGWNFD